MKIDQIFIKYLLTHKELRLQEIGVFKLEGNVSEPAEPSKPIIIPSDAIRFEYDPRTPEDADLVAFISESTGKIKPLASADLDSYLALGKQFLNIGKPMIIPNIGTLEKASSGVLNFKGGEYVIEKLESERKVPEIEEAEPTEDDSFSDLGTQKHRNGRGWLYLILVAILGLIGWALWNYDFKQEESDTLTQTEATTPTDTIPHASTPAPADTATAPISDSLQSTPAPAPTDSTRATPAASGNGFKIVVGVYKLRSTAERRVEELQLIKSNISIISQDSTGFWVVESVNRPLSDTTRVKDSLRIFYGPRPYPAYAIIK